MRRSRPRYPRPQDIAPVRAALCRIPVDSPLREGWRESAKLAPNWRFLGTTGGAEWVVDVYCGGFCYVCVGSASERTRSLPATVRFLLTHLAARGALVC